MVSIGGVRKYLPSKRAVVAFVITLALQAEAMVAADHWAGALGAFVGGYLVVYFVGGWIYDKVTGSSEGSSADEGVAAE